MNNVEDGTTKTIKFRKNMHFDDMYEKLTDVASEVCDYGGLCRLTEANIYYKGKLLLLVEMITTVKFKNTMDKYYHSKNTKVHQHLYLKTVRSLSTKVHLKNVFNMLDGTDFDVDNVEYIVNGYLAKTSHVILTFEHNAVSKIELHLVDL